MKSMIITWLAWLRTYLNLPRILIAIFKSIDQLDDKMAALEAAHLHGQMVHTVYVPDGMSPEVAWRNVREGYELDRTGKKTFVLVDWKGDLLKVLS